MEEYVKIGAEFARMPVGGANDLSLNDYKAQWEAWSTLPHQTTAAQQQPK